MTTSTLAVAVMSVVGAPAMATRGSGQISVPTAALTLLGGRSLNWRTHGVADYEAEHAHILRLADMLSSGIRRRPGAFH